MLVHSTKAKQCEKEIHSKAHRFSKKTRSKEKNEVKKINK